MGDHFKAFPENRLKLPGWKLGESPFYLKRFVVVVVGDGVDGRITRNRNERVKEKKATTYFPHPLPQLFSRCCPSFRPVALSIYAPRDHCCTGLDYSPKKAEAYYAPHG